MKKLVLLICLLFPFYVFADNLKFGDNYFDCQRFQSNGITTSGSGQFNYCIKASCSNGYWQTKELFIRGEGITCSNGNTSFYKYIISSGCNEYQNVCTSTGSYAYCGITYAFDCSRAADGSVYVPRNTTTTPTTKRTTTKKTTTKRTTTKRPSSGTTTTTTTTTVPVKDNNSFLSSLTINGYEINFYKEKLSYEIVINKDVKKLDISYETDSDKATAVIKNNDPISVDNPITITVTAEDGTSKDYTIKLTYKALSNNVNIKKITIDNHDFVFDNNNQNYDIVLKEDEQSLVFNIELEDENARYEIENNRDLVNGSVIDIKVIAEDETETTYKFNIIKETIVTPKKSNGVFRILLILIVFGVIGFVAFKFIRNIMPAKEDKKYDYE